MHCPPLLPYPLHLPLLPPILSLLLLQMNRRYPLVIFPAFRLQDRMQKLTLGPDRWNVILKSQKRFEAIDNYLRINKELPNESFSAKISCKPSELQRWTERKANVKELQFALRGGRNMSTSSTSSGASSVGSRRR